MITFPAFFSSLLEKQPELLAMSCLEPNNLYKTLRNGLYVCSTTPELSEQREVVFEKILALFQINFVNNSSLSLKDKYFNLRNVVSIDTESFSGNYWSGVLTKKNGYGVFVFEHTDFELLNKHNLEIESFKIPENLHFHVKDMWRLSGLANLSDNFLVIIPRKNSAIYVYDPKGITCLRTLNLEGEICQQQLVGDSLYVLRMNENYSMDLIIFDLSKPEQFSIIVNLPTNYKFETQYSFFSISDEYFIYMQAITKGKHKLHALPLSCLQNFNPIGQLPWIFESDIKENRYFFPQDDHFIEVCFNDCYTFDLYKVIIESNTFIKTKLEEIVLSEDKEALRAGVCFDNDHIFFAYDHSENSLETKIFSYDIRCRKVNTLCTIPRSSLHCIFKPRFFTTEQKVHYLVMGYDTPRGIQPGPLQADLATLTYHKV